MIETKRKSNAKIHTKSCTRERRKYTRYFVHNERCQIVGEYGQNPSSHNSTGLIITMPKVSRLDRQLSCFKERLRGSNGALRFNEASSQISAVCSPQNNTQSDGVEVYLHCDRVEIIGTV